MIVFFGFPLPVNRSTDIAAGCIDTFSIRIDRRSGGSVLARDVIPYILCGIVYGCGSIGKFFAESRCKRIDVAAQESIERTLCKSCLILLLQCRICFIGSLTHFVAAGAVVQKRFRLAAHK